MRAMMTSGVVGIARSESEAVTARSESEAVTATSGEEAGTEMGDTAAAIVKDEALEASADLCSAVGIGRAHV